MRRAVPTSPLYIKLMPLHERGIKTKDHIVMYRKEHAELEKNQN